MKSMWHQQYYYMFGFLGVIFAVLVIVCVELTLVIIYWLLCNEVYLFSLLSSNMPLTILSRDWLVRSTIGGGAPSLSRRRRPSTSSSLASTIT